jgi:hypothetical protein
VQGFFEKAGLFICAIQLPNTDDWQQVFATALGVRFWETRVVTPSPETEHDGGTPRAWAEGFARLDPAGPPSDVPPHRLERFVYDLGRFLDGPFCGAASPRRAWRVLAWELARISQTG